MNKETIMKPISDTQYKLIGFIMVSISMWFFGLICFKFFPILLNTDDMAYKYILSGAYSGKPEAHVYFIKYPLSLILAKLYGLFPEGNVYFWFLTFANYVSMTLIIYRLILYTKVFILKIILPMLMFVLFLFFFFEYHWTTSAGLLGAASIVWYATRERNGDKKAFVIDCVIIISTFALSFNLRSTVAKLYLPFFFLTFMYRNIPLLLKKEVKKTIKEAVIFLGAFLICISCHFVHEVEYSTDEWKEAIDFLDYRSLLNDRYGFPDYDKNIDVYNEAGIDKATYLNLANDLDYQLATTGRVDSQALKIIAERAKKLYENGEWDKLYEPKFPGYIKETFAQTNNTIDRILACVKYRFEIAFGEDYLWYTVTYLFFLLLSIIMCLLHKEYLSVIVTVVFAIVNELVWCYLIYGGRLPTHVVHCLNMINISFVFSKCSYDFSKFKLTRIRWVSIVLLICFVIFGGFVGYTNIEKSIIKSNRQVKITEIKKLVYEYCDEHQDNIYFRDVLSLNYYELYSDQIGNKGQNCLPYVTWISSFPIECQYITMDGSVNLSTSIVGMENIYFVVKTGKADEACERKIALFESKGISCSLELTDTIVAQNGESIDVYHFIWE